MHFKVLSAICFNLDWCKILSYAKGLKYKILKSLTIPELTLSKTRDFKLFQIKNIKDDKLTHYQMTKFRLFQTERVCRRQFQI